MASELKDFPPKLQKLARFIEENHSFKSLKEACELADVNYDSVRVLMARYKKKGNDFNELLYSLLNKRNSRELTFVDNALLKECLKDQGDGSSPNIQAMKLFYQRTGALDSTKQQINVNQTINKMYAVPVSPIPPADLRKDSTVQAPSNKAPSDQYKKKTTITQPTKQQTVKTIYPTNKMIHLKNP